jgi:pimeloyl-ACP methyl ester carboxylesterase
MDDRWKHELVEANGIRFHCVTAGDGPLVLLLHGFPQFWYGWRHQIPALASRFKVVAPDLRGYNDTTKPPRVADYRTGVLAVDVACLVRVFGYEKAHLVGHDWGGGVAWTTALQHPQVVAKLAVLNCPHPVLFVKALRSDLRQLGRSWYMFFFQIPAIPELVFRLFSTANRGADVPWPGSPQRDIHGGGSPTLSRGAREAGRAHGSDQLLSGDVSQFHCHTRARACATGHRRPPTLLIWAENDAALGKELTYGMEPLFGGPFRIHYVPECSHCVNEEQPELVNRLLLEFLDGTESL